MGVKIAFGSRGNGGGEQMNGGQQYQNNGPNMGGQQYPNNGQPMQAGPMMGLPLLGGSQPMNYGAAASYPVQHGPYVPGHHIPAPVAAQMGYLAPLEGMGADDMYPADFGMEEMRRGRSSRTGRYVHRAGMDGGEQMRGAGGSSGGMDMGHAEADEDEDGEVGKLKRKVRKLSRKLQKLEEELEEKEEQGRKKKKKPHKEEEEEDDDDEDDPKKKLSCALSGLLSAFPTVAETVFGVVASPPPTWADYLKRSDFGGIAKMEFGELMQAVQAKKPLKDLKKELSHTAAALLMLCGKS